MTLQPAGGLPPQGWSLGELYKQTAARPVSKQQVSLAKKGAPWSDDEHKAFLNGLKMYGRGQWKQISRYFVPSRTPTQVASHAQKHFLRQNGAQKRRSRFSAVEEAAMAAAVVAPAPPALAALQHGLVLPPPGVGMPAGVFGAPLGPPAAASAAAGPRGFPFPLPLQQQQQALRLPAAPPLPPGVVRGGVVLGTPIGVLPPLPSITTASGTELPILPVMPGRINALTASAAPPPTAVPAVPATSYSGDSSGSELAAGSKPPSPTPGPLGAPPGAAAAGLPFSTQYAASGRSRQLLRLLELNERLSTDRGSSGGAAAAPQASGAPRSLPSQQEAQQAQQEAEASVHRVPSATAALDTLASLAEAEAASDQELRTASQEPASASGAAGDGGGADGAAPQQQQLHPAAAHSARTPLVSAF